MVLSRTRCFGPAAPLAATLQRCAPEAVEAAAAAVRALTLTHTLTLTLTLTLTQTQTLALTLALTPTLALALAGGALNLPYISTVSPLISPLYLP